MGGDKCYQLRRALNQFNTSAKAAFKIPRNMAFDEGGIGTRSRYCPVRQYNSNKPNKFRVDFFVLSDSENYAILHLDVYQGRNTSMVNIPRLARGLPTTQRAVVTACHAIGLDRVVDGCRHIAADNRYMCPELLVLLRLKFNCLGSGTCRANRTGWDTKGWLLKKTSPRGTVKLYYDSTNKIICGQWNDNKVVNFVSSWLNKGVVDIKRQVGPNKKIFKCSSALVYYQKTMGAVDKGDQMRAHGGGFSTKVHFKRWYKRVFLGLLDCMLLNSHLAWNMAASSIRSREEMRRHEHYWYIAQYLCTYKDPYAFVDRPFGSTTADDVPFSREHVCIKLTGVAMPRCAVCRLEWNWMQATMDKGDMCKYVSKCRKCNIQVHANFLEDSNRFIHKQPEFEGLTCFQIAHTAVGRNLWKRSNGVTNPSEGRYSYSLNKQSFMYKRLRLLHGMPEEHTRKRDRKQSEVTNEEEKEQGSGVDQAGVQYI